MRNAPRLGVIQPLWAHSIASAVIAETLGAVRGLSVSALYTAGLVHDVGRVGLFMATENRYARLVAQPVAGVEKACAPEKEQFGLTHSEAGGIMAVSWGFPAWLCSANRYHHMDETRPPDERPNLSAWRVPWPAHWVMKSTAIIALETIRQGWNGRTTRVCTIGAKSLQPRISSLLAAISRPA
jgi:hypothetical protein